MISEKIICHCGWVVAAKTDYIWKIIKNANYNLNITTFQKLQTFQEFKLFWPQTFVNMSKINVCITFLQLALHLKCYLKKKKIDNRNL